MGFIAFLVFLVAIFVVAWYFPIPRTSLKPSASSPEKDNHVVKRETGEKSEAYAIMGDSDRERELLAKIREVGLTHQTSIQRAGGRNGKGLYFAVLPWPSESDKRIVETEIPKEDYFGNPDGTKKLTYSVLSEPKEDSSAIRVAKSIVELTKEVAQKHGCHPYYGGPKMVAGGALVMYFGLGDKPVTKNPA